MQKEQLADLVRFYQDNRAWEAARHQLTFGQASHSPFTVLTFNILAQGHIKRTLFPYCAKDTLKWAYRRERLMAELQAYDADICAFQVSMCRVMTSIKLSRKWTIMKSSSRPGWQG